MKKTKTKAKTAPKEAGRSSVQGKVVKIRSGKARPGLTSKVSAVRQYWGHTKDFLAESVQEMKL